MHERLFSSFEVKFADGEQPGAFEGYGAYFGNVDAYGDVIAKGAFKDTLKDYSKRKTMPKMLVQHGGWGMTDRDGLPVGKWQDMSEDDSGLYVKGRLINLDTEAGKSLYGALKEGVLDSMSIGYRAKSWEMGTKPEEPRRTLKKVDLYEVSLVTFPANPEARVQSVKSATEMTIRDFERALVSGTLPPMSEREAKALLADGFNAFRTERDASDEGRELKDLILRNIETLTKRG